MIRPWPKVAATALGLLIVAGVVWARPGVPRAAGPAETPIIAVLPVEAPPGVLNSGLAVIGRTLTESIIGKLTTLTGSRAVVLSETQTAGLLGEARTLEGVRQLGAQFFVDVTLRPTAGPVFVHAQLATVSGSILWSTDYELDQADAESVQIALAQRIARCVAQEVAPAPTRTARLLMRQ